MAWSLEKQRCNQNEKVQFKLSQTFWHQAKESFC